MTAKPTQNPDQEEETPVAKSAEDRKAANALAHLDARDESSAASNVDQDAVSAAMKTLGGGAAGAGGAGAKGLPVRNKNVKVDQADVALLVGSLSSFVLEANGESGI